MSSLSISVRGSGVFFDFQLITVMFKVYYCRGATLHDIIWCFCEPSLRLRNDLLSEKAFAQQQRGNKNGWNSLWCRKGTVLTLITHCHWFHWLDPFSGWKYVIQGNQLLLCCLGREYNHAGPWEGSGGHFSTYTYFCPLVIRVGLRYHFHLWMQKANEREKKKTLARWCLMLVEYNVHQK